MSGISDLAEFTNCRDYTEPARLVNIDLYYLSATKSRTYIDIREFVFNGLFILHAHTPLERNLAQMIPEVVGSCRFREPTEHEPGLFT